MAAMVIRNLSDETHRALKASARRHGRSAEAEARFILAQALGEDRPTGLGTLLDSVRREVGGVDLDVERDKAPYGPVDLS